ncbi:MAG: hypothetical protein ACXAD7_16895 [Candidatus Kariarchaeaceae archaeon]|jgi:hypothetical protein
MFELNKLNSQSKSNLLRVNALAQDTILLRALGEVVTIQIDLIDYQYAHNYLKEQFNDPEKDGLYINGSIYYAIMEMNDFDFLSIFLKIAEITGNYGSIDGITALIRVYIKDNPIEITLELLGGHRPPQLINVSDRTIYFEIMNFIQFRWHQAKSLFN